MFKHYFERVEGIEFFPILSLVIFVLFFVGLLIWVLRVNKGYIREMSDLPLKDDQPLSATAATDRPKPLMDMRTNGVRLQKYLFPVLTWLGVLGLSGAAQAQDKSAVSETTMVAYILVGLVLFVLVAILIVVLYLAQLIWLLKANLAAQSGGASEVHESFWVSLKKKHITGDLLPVEQEQSLLIDHSYDGIQELNNYMPPWLKYVFWGTIAFAVVYLFNFAVLGLVQTSEQEYVAEVAAAEEHMEAYKLLAVKGINEDNVKLVKDAASLKTAKTIFVQNCQACHGAAGEGGVGPNLTDEYWLHGGEVKEVFKTIKYGIPQKGMIAWQQKLQPDQIQQLASYILTLQGTNPANAKAPQGDKKQTKEVSMR